MSSAGSTIQMIDASGSDTNPAFEYPCFEHPTLTDLLDVRTDLALLHLWRHRPPDRTQRH
jgi:hypothetical protein